MKKFDAILVPGGGLLGNGALYPWVKSRFDEALEIASQHGANSTPHIIALSGGSCHAKHPDGENGFPRYESVVGVEYLKERNYPSEKILYETCSFDTQGK